MLKHGSGGILLVDKEENLTSHGVVSLVKKKLGGKQAPKVGHAGTLDPFATGLLLIMVGQATKLSPYLSGEDKKYRAVIRLGEATDTFDRTGSIVKRGGEPYPDIGVLQSVLAKFTGSVVQIPPIYSAVKHRGVRAYKLARKGLEVPLGKRRVDIFGLRLLEYDPPLATMEIHCSKGTYIRSLAADIGETLGTLAHLAELRRLSIGAFRLDEGMPSSELKAGGVCRESILSRLMEPVDALRRLESVHVSPEMAARIRQGHHPSFAEMGVNGSDFRSDREALVKVVVGRELVAVGRLNEGARSITPGLRIEKAFFPVQPAGPAA